MELIGRKWRHLGETGPQSPPNKFGCFQLYKYFLPRRTATELFVV